MKNTIIFIFIFQLFTLSTLAQNTDKETELLDNLENSTNNTELLNSYMELINYYSTFNLKLMEKNIKKVQKLLKKQDISNENKSITYKKIAEIYYNKNYLDKSIFMYRKLIEILKISNNNKKLNVARYNLGLLEYKQKKYKDASSTFEDILFTVGSTIDDIYLEKLYSMLYHIYKDWGKSDKALENLEALLLINNKKFTTYLNKIEILEDNYEQERTTRERTENQLKTTQKNLNKTDNILKQTGNMLIEEQQKTSELEVDTQAKYNKIMELKADSIERIRNLEKQKAETNYQKLLNVEKQKTISLLIFVIIFFLIIAILVFILYRRIKSNNKELKEQKTQIEAQNIELAEQKNQIIESIHYASKIQQSILISEKSLQEFIPNLFIYYQPRDIVSGDFYWFSKILDVYILSVIDCTGHGVPGAFLSTIGNTLLNKIVNEEHCIEPAEILTKLHKGLSDTLQKDTNITETEDGMDMTLISIAPKQNKFTVAAAKNSLIIATQDEITLVPADFYTIGQKPLRPGTKITFTQHEYDYTDATNIYMTTDGYIDQFGGIDNEEKFGFEQFETLLTKICTKSADEQKDTISKTIDEWKNNHEAIDDMLIIGMNFKNLKEIL